jgi:hypothetical protein
MTEREAEHLAVARRFGPGRVFSRDEFQNLYRQVYPGRPLGSMIPSDFCENLHAKGTENNRRFLRWLRRGKYELIAEKKRGQS